jgi:nitrite reductase/ring-hydroxylating ferredoxin subunit
LPETVASQVVCAAEELPPGQMIATRLGRLPVVVVRDLDGTLHALHDRCLHQGARLSGGRLLRATHGQHPGEYVEDQGQLVVKCPWHGYEYDVRTGCTLFDLRLRVRRLAVREERGVIVVARSRE